MDISQQTLSNELISQLVSTIPSAKSIGKYQIKQTLGKGKFKVKLAVDPNTNKLFAVKVYSKRIVGEAESFFQRERSATQNFNHNNILKLHDILENQIYKNKKGQEEKFNVLVLEYAENGDLFEMIMNTGKLQEQLARTLFHQLIAGLEHIHHRGYVHLDLKPDNIYVDENFKLKLADFDLSKSSDSKYKGPVGSYSYMAPEILEYKEYDGKQVDIFALGVTLFAMVSGGLPFSNAKYNDPIYKYFFMENERFFWERHEKEQKYGKTFKQLIELMLCYNPGNRGTLDDIKNSEWYNEPVLSEKELYEVMHERYTKAGKKNMI